MKISVKTKLLATVAVVVMMGWSTMRAQSISDAQLANVQQVVKAFLPSNMGIGELKARSVTLDGDEVVVDLSENFGDVPFTKASIDSFKKDIKSALGGEYAGKDVRLTITGNDIDNYFAEFDTDYKRRHTPFITELDQHRHYKKALDGNIVAVWPSHGWYFEPYLNRWEWQRARMFQTVEDMYTHSYMIPFIMPMLTKERSEL